MRYRCCLDCSARWRRIPLGLPKEVTPTGHSRFLGGQAPPEDCVNLEAPKCPSHGEMAPKRNRTSNELFWGCRMFPDCTQTNALMIDGHRARVETMVLTDENNGAGATDVKVESSSDAEAGFVDLTMGDSDST